jgi:hypothetical protein
MATKRIALNGKRPVRKTVRRAKPARTTALARAAKSGIARVRRAVKAKKVIRARKPARVTAIAKPSAVMGSHFMSRSFSF